MDGDNSAVNDAPPEEDLDQPLSRWQFDKHFTPVTYRRITISLCSFKTQYGGIHGMEEHTLKNVNNCLNTNIYSYLETSGGQSSNPYLNVVHLLNTRAD